MKITFNVSGTVTQTIEIYNGELIETIVSKLNSGDYLTTILNGNDELFIIEYKNNEFIKIAKILYSDEYLEFTDFENEE